MNETLKFNLTHRLKTYGNMLLLTHADAEAFVKLCKENKIPIYAFEGFHLFPNMSVQIDQDYSRDYSELDANTAYNLALEFFKEHKEDKIGYEFVYDDPGEDWKVIRSLDEAEKKKI